MFLVLTLAALVAATQFEPPPGRDTCLTNACSAPLTPIATARNEAAIAGAIRSNDLAGLYTAGGSPAEALKIMQATCDRPGGPACARLPLPDTAEFRFLPGPDVSALPPGTKSPVAVVVVGSNANEIGRAHV